MRVIYASAFCIASFVGMSLQSSTAGADFRVFHASMCKTSDTAVVNPPDAGEVSSQSLEFFTCPVMTDSSFDPGSSSTIVLDGWNRPQDTSGYVLIDFPIMAKACRTYAGGNGGECGANVTASFNSTIHLYVPSTNWAYSEDSKYLYVLMPGAVGTVHNKIWSYRVSI
jgi:hypothetical protein